MGGEEWYTGFNDVCKVGVRTMKCDVQSLQLQILQEFFKLQMAAAYGTSWTCEVARVVEEKFAADDQFKHNYIGIKNILDNEGVETLDEKRMDVTVLSSLILYNFLNECRVGSKFEEHIQRIRNDKNVLISHLSNPTDILEGTTRKTQALMNLRNFLRYLANSDWQHPRKVMFTSKFLKVIESAAAELTGDTSSQAEDLKKLSFGRLEELADGGVAEAQLEMAVRLEAGFANGDDYEDNNALELLKDAADAGNAEAQARLALKLFSGNTVDEQSVRTASVLLAKAKNAKCPYVDYVYGRIAQFGLGGEEKNERRAYQKYCEAANAGCFEAKVQKAYCQAMGIGTEKDRLAGLGTMENLAEEANSSYAYSFLGDYYHQNKQFADAVRCYEKGAQSGYLYSEYTLGKCYYYGDGVARDFEKAFTYFDRAADKGHVGSTYMLGKCYYYGNGVSKDVYAAFERFKTAMIKGYAAAKVMVGECFYFGRGTEKSLTNAVKLFSLAKDEGDTDGEYWFGVCCLYGRGRDKNYDEAVACFTRAVDKGSAPAQLELGKCCFYGMGVPQDRQKAFELLKGVEDRAFTDGDFLLGECYYYNQGVERDHDKAFAYYQRAAENGHVQSKHMLGVCYFYGNGTERDCEKAFEQFKSIEEKGIGQTLYKLGQCYYFGFGTEEDYTKAFTYLTRAVEKGVRVANVLLGECYAYGHGVTADTEQAIACYEQGDAAGDTAGRKGVIDLLLAKEEYHPLEQICLKHRWFDELTVAYFEKMGRVMRERERETLAEKVLLWLKRAKAAGYQEADERMTRLDLLKKDPFLHNVMFGTKRSKKP